MDESVRAKGVPVLMHGLVVAGDVPLAGVSDDRAPDFTVRFEPSAPIDGDPLEGDIVAALDVPGTSYDAVRDGDHLRVRFREAALFDIDLATGEISARAEPGREGMLPIMLGGTVLSLILGLREEPVLHASAVVAGGRCAAIAGPSGVGKSTVAYLLCEAGMKLLTEDTARIEFDSDDASIHRGANEIRLRGPAAEAAAARSGELRKTADHRAVIGVPHADEALAPLGSILFPAWSEDFGAPAVTHLSERQALDALMSSPRVAGWTAPGPLRANFECFTQLAFADAYLLELPRGQLSDPGLAAELAAVVSATLDQEG